MNVFLAQKSYQLPFMPLSKSLSLLFVSSPRLLVSSHAQFINTFRFSSSTPLPSQATSDPSNSSKLLSSTFNDKNESPITDKQEPSPVGSDILSKTKNFVYSYFQWLSHPTKTISRFKIPNKIFSNSDSGLRGSSATWTQTLVEAASLVALHEQRGVYHVTTQIQHLISNDHPLLDRIAKYYFTQPGKQLRPLIVLLLSQATSTRTEDPAILPSQRRLAEITELIHTASLLHDDVIDNADLRRNVASVNAVHGNKLAVLAGDFLLARASVALAHLRQLEVIELLSTVLADLVQGEIMQMQSASTNGMDGYLDRIYRKTASLIAKSCRAAAVLGDVSQDVAENAYVYGKHLGMAFQLIDDVLDLTTTSNSQLGKPVHADIHSGVITAPMLFAMEDSPDFRTLVERKFAQPGDEERAVGLLHRSDAFKKTKQLAEHHCSLAVAAINNWTPSPAKKLLIDLANTVLYRTK